MTPKMVPARRQAPALPCRQCPVQSSKFDALVAAASDAGKRAETVEGQGSRLCLSQYKLPSVICREQRCRHRLPVGEAEEVLAMALRGILQPPETPPPEPGTSSPSDLEIPISPTGQQRVSRLQGWLVLKMFQRAGYLPALGDMDED